MCLNLIDNDDEEEDDDDENSTSLPYPCAPVPQPHSAPLKKRLVGENCAAASLAPLDILAKLWSSELQAQILSEIFVAASSFDLVGKLWSSELPLIWSQNCGAASLAIDLVCTQLSLAPSSSSSS